MSLIHDFEKLSAKLKRRIFNMLARGVVQLIDDRQGYQIIQSTLLADETRTGLERMQQYGFTGHPPVGSETVVLFLNGDRSHGVVIAIDNRQFRLRDLEEGDIAVYTNKGNFCKLKADGEMILETPESNITLETKDGKIYLKATDNIIIQSEKVARLEGEQVEIVAKTKLKLDCGGRGWDHLPTNSISWTVGSQPDVPMPITPPEHPGTPAS